HELHSAILILSSPHMNRYLPRPQESGPRYTPTRFRTLPSLLLPARQYPLSEEYRTPTPTKHAHLLICLHPAALRAGIRGFAWPSDWITSRPDDFGSAGTTLWAFRTAYV